MKACILAGGEGRRLRPLTSHMPKPLVPILGKPVIVRIIEQLRAHAVTDMAVTMMYLPEMIRAELQDGSEWGANLHYFEEKHPLGTAGGVRACKDFLAGDDFIVISGDAVCDFDLSEAFRFHREHHADATIILTRQDNPLEYGLVQTDRDGQILRFTEKPAWGEVFTDVVNTGIYILSPHILDEIPSDQPYDFSKDLFPKLLARGARLMGCELRGYWCDIGDTAAYLRCSLDALQGTVQLSPPESVETVEGVTKPRNMLLTEGAVLKAPVQIEPGAVIMPGAQIGPNVWLGSQSYVGENAVVTDSVISGTLAAQCEAEGAVIGPGSYIGSGTVLCRNAVIGSGVRIGDHCFIGGGVRVYPDIRVADGAVVRSTLTAGEGTRVVFEDGAVTGVFGSGLTAEAASALGAACAEIVPSARVALGATGGADAQSLAQSLLGGLTAAGCSVYTHDAAFAAGAAAMTHLLKVPLSVFVDSADELAIRLYGADGTTLSTSLQRKIEGIVARGELRRVPSPAAGRQLPVSGVRDLFAAAAGAAHAPRKLQVAVHGHHPAAMALAAALVAAGFSVPTQPALYFEGLTVSISRDGFHFSVADTQCRLDCRETEALVLLAAMQEHSGRAIAIVSDAPEVYEKMAVEYGAKILRLGRDKGAEEAYAAQHFTQNAVAGAVSLLCFLDARGTTLSALRQLLPTFGTHTESVDCSCERGTLMRRLAEECGACAGDRGRGLCFRFEQGTVRVQPSAARQALKIFAEGASEEIARELAADVRTIAERIGRESTD
ncbi:MAG: hypothetical protein E7452_05595 [Ruminococcaceae bacterium]|nr:hypothetical protein [Oscillospiraceae bacterium]